MKFITSWKTFNENIFDHIPETEYDINSISEQDRKELIQEIENAKDTKDIESYSDEVEYFTEELALLINSALEIYLSYDYKEKLYNLFKQNYDIQVVSYEKEELSADDILDYENEYNSKSVENNITKYITGLKKHGWTMFHEEDNYSSIELIYIKA